LPNCAKITSPSIHRSFDSASRALLGLGVVFFQLRHGEALFDEAPGVALSHHLHIDAAQLRHHLFIDAAPADSPSWNSIRAVSLKL